MRKALVALSGLALVVALAPQAAAEPAGCAGLTGAEIPAAAIGLPTGGGVVTAAQVVPAAGAIGEYCRVDAAIRPLDPAAPEIRLRVALPAQWNRKAMMFGGGGYNGTVPNVAGDVPFGRAGQASPLARGYATFASDSGHQATPGFLPTPSLDGSFAVNDEALRNFAGDALKKTRDAAMFVIGAHYAGAAPERSYFAGGSTGGREALAVAQRWPADFDGVISVFPAWNAASLNLFFGHAARQLAAPGAFPGPVEQALLYRSVIDSCDGGDGLVDGVISAEAECDFDPAVLRCPDGVAPGPKCLSDEQIRAVETLSAPLRWGYPLAGGETGYPGFPFLSGADMTTPLLGMGITAPATPMPPTAGYGPQFWAQWVRFAVTRDPGFDALALDPLAPGPWQQRISELAGLQDVNDPDLRPFAAAGGKLLVLHGTADELVSHRSTVEYMERVAQTVGRGQLGKFARFYLVPGANHANLDAAFAAGWDSVDTLERWVEAGEAPRHEVVTDNNSGRTRPLCDYPRWPRYVGNGDPNVAQSFRCQR